DLPFEIDTEKLDSTSTRKAINSTVALRDEGTTTWSGQIQYSDSSSVAVMYDDGGGKALSVTQSAPFTFANTDLVTIEISDVPIKGWSADGKLVGTFNASQVKDVCFSHTYSETEIRCGQRNGVWMYRRCFTVGSDIDSNTT